MEKLLIPWNVKVIEQSAFEKCTGLSQVTVQDGVTHIAEKDLQTVQILRRSSCQKQSE